MTDRHVPESQPDAFVVHKMACLDACLEEEAAVEEAKGGPVKGITDAFSSELFAQLKLNNNFTPNDSMHSLSSVRPARGRGRGIMLKKSA